MEQFSGPVDDSLCIGQRRPQDRDERVLLFIKMRAGQKFTPALADEIKAAIRKGLSARHVPSHIFEVWDIPVSKAFMEADFELSGSFKHCIVYGEWQEDRNCGQTNSFGFKSAAEWHGCEPSISAAVLQV